MSGMMDAFGELILSTNLGGMPTEVRVAKSGEVIIKQFVVEDHVEEVVLSEEFFEIIRERLDERRYGAGG